MKRISDEQPRLSMIDRAIAARRNDAEERDGAKCTNDVVNRWRCRCRGGYNCCGNGAEGRNGNESGGLG